MWHNFLPYVVSFLSGNTSLPPTTRLQPTTSYELRAAQEKKICSEYLEHGTRFTAYDHTQRHSDYPLDGTRYVAFLDNTHLVCTFGNTCDLYAIDKNRIIRHIHHTKAHQDDTIAGIACTQAPSSQPYVIITALNNQKSKQYYLVLYRFHPKTSCLQKVQTFDSNTTEGHLYHIALSHDNTICAVGTERSCQLFTINKLNGLLQNMSKIAYPYSRNDTFSLIEPKNLIYRKRLHASIHIVHQHELVHQHERDTILLSLIPNTDTLLIIQKYIETTLFKSNLLTFAHRVLMSRCGTMCVAFQDARGGAHPDDRITLYRTLNIAGIRLKNPCHLIQRNDEELSYASKTRAALDMAFSHDGRQLAAGFSDGSFVMWNTQTGKDIQYFQHDTASIVKIAFAPDNRIALYQENGKIMIVDHVEHHRS